MLAKMGYRVLQEQRSEFHRANQRSTKRCVVAAQVALCWFNAKAKLRRTVTGQSNAAELDSCCQTSYAFPTPFAQRGGYFCNSRMMTIAPSLMSARAALNQ